MKKILIAIPAYNEEDRIGRVIAGIKKENIKLDILVVNDGSQDKTNEEASGAGALVLNLPTNLGIGGARQAAFIYALKNNYNKVLQMDADGQHPASNIKKLISASKSADVIIGSRFLFKTNYKAPLIRRFGIILLSFVLRIITKKNFTDPTSGLRIFSGKTISFLARYSPTDYPEVEPLLFLYWAGYKIKEIKAIMLPRQSGKSSIAPFYYMIKVILALFINLLRERPKLEEK